MGLRLAGESWENGAINRYMVEWKEGYRDTIQQEIFHQGSFTANARLWINGELIYEHSRFLIDTGSNYWTARLIRDFD